MPLPVQLLLLPRCCCLLLLLLLLLLPRCCNPSLAVALIQENHKILLLAIERPPAFKDCNHPTYSGLECFWVEVGDRPAPTPVDIDLGICNALANVFECCTAA